MKMCKWLVIGLCAASLACGQGNTSSSKSDDDTSRDGDGDTMREPPPGAEDIDTDTFVAPGARATRRLTAAQIRNSVKVALGLGKGRDRVLTCDLTKDYVAINGDYRS